MKCVLCNHYHQPWMPCIEDSAQDDSLLSSLLSPRNYLLDNPVIPSYELPKPVYDPLPKFEPIVPYEPPTPRFDLLPKFEPIVPYEPPTPIYDPLPKFEPIVPYEPPTPRFDLLPKFEPIIPYEPPTPIYDPLPKFEPIIPTSRRHRASTCCRSLNRSSLTSRRHPSTTRSRSMSRSSRRLRQSTTLGTASSAGNPIWTYHSHRQWFDPGRRSRRICAQSYGQYHRGNGATQYHHATYAA